MNRTEANVPVDAEQATGRLERLYREHAPQAGRLAYLLTADRELAQDLAQEAFVRAAARSPLPPNPEAFGAYVRTTVVNLCRAHWRKRKQERSYLEKEGPTVAAGRYEDPDLALRDDLLQALQKLPERQRLALVLRYYQDLSEQQTAEILRCRVGTVKSLTSRALEALRSQPWGDYR